MSSDKDVIEVVRKGVVFSAVTVKGNKTLLYCMGVMSRDQMVYFVHAGMSKTGGARITKHTLEATVQAIQGGDLEVVQKGDIDWGKFIPSSLGLTAMSQRQTAEQYMDRLVGD